MRTFRRQRAGRRVTVAAATLGLVAASIGGVAATGPADAAPVRAAAVGDLCPAAMPIADITAGMTGQGLTVVTGNTPQTFDVEVLGLLKDGIAPGHDMVIIKVSDVPGQDVISAGGGGIWAGMSGSPVYVGDQLLGAVSYGFSAGPSPIGGLTPAADMVKVLDYPTKATAAASAQARPSATTTTKKVTAAARKLAGSTAATGGSLRQLRTPLAVSGLSSRRLDELQSTMDQLGRPVIVHSSGSGNAPRAAAVPEATPVPGGNFVGALAYGDLSMYGTGTTTAVCDGKALAFGHPLNFAGAVTYGANDGNSFGIIRDDTFGSFKLADIGASFGTLDQDRYTAIRADLSTTPATSPVRTVITSTEGSSRDGTTDVVDQESMGAVSFYGVYFGFDSAIDRIGRGRTNTAWSITGKRANGKPLYVSRQNRFASLYDVSEDPATELANAVESLSSNEFEPVTIDEVTFRSTVNPAYNQLRITKMSVSVNGGTYRQVGRVVVKPGDVLRVHTVLQGYRTSATSTLYSIFRVPAKSKGRTGALTSTGGVDAAYGDDDFSDECLFDPSLCEEDVNSLDAIIKGIKSPPRNDTVLTDLTLEDEEGNTSTKLVTQPRTTTVTGEHSIRVLVR